MSNLRTHCESCGAPVDLHAEKCAYCDTPYRLRAYAPEADKLQTAGNIADLLQMGAITINEARRRLGLEEV